MKIFYSIVLLLLFSNSLFIAEATRGPSNTSKVKPVDPNVKTHPAHGVPTETLEPAAIKFFKMKLLDEQIKNPKEEKILNSSETFLAFTFYDEKEKAHRIFFKQIKTDKLYEIEGVPLKHRPFSDLFWKDDSTLVFDRWSNPHFGYHYEVDVVNLEFKVAAAFPD